MCSTCLLVSQLLLTFCPVKNHPVERSDEGKKLVYLSVTIAIRFDYVSLNKYRAAELVASSKHDCECFD